MDNAGEDVTSLKDGGVILHKLPAVYPEEFDTVSLRYSLLHDGQIIEKDTEVTFVIDETEDLRICPGLEIAVKKLQVFEQARVLMTAEYGFGSEGHVALNVPPGAQIEYEIQVLALSKAKKISDLDVGQRLGLAEQRRVNATALSRIKCYKKAAYIFKSVLEILDNREDFFVLKADKKRRNAILLEAYVGLASCDLFLENFQEVIEAANSAIALSNIGSAYFRRAQAHQKLFLFKQAMLDYEKVIAIEPLNEAAAERLEECRIQLRKKCLIENSHQLVRLALQTAESQVPVAEAASKRALNSPLSTNPAKKAKLTEAHASDEIVEREDFLLKEMSALSEVFPENDPNELYAMLENAVDKEDRIILVINELFSTANYVELEDKINAEMTPETFLKLCPNPEKEFSDTTEEMTTIYIQHALAFLNEKFRHFSSGFISRKLNKHNNHLVPTYRELAKFNPSAFDRVKSIFLGTPNRTDVFDPPAKMDKAFFMERFYIENELCILNLIADLEITREIEISQAVENQSVQVCSKCSQHCLIKDSICCAGGHIICRICMDNYMAASVHNSMTRLVCQSPGCNNTIPVVKFKLLGTSKLYKTLERLVLKANLQGLVGCPVCFYLTEEINCSSKRFSCQNPDCLRDSCMDCKKMWHEPFKCGVVFQATQTSSTSISSGE